MRAGHLDLRRPTPSEIFTLGWIVVFVVILALDRSRLPESERIAGSLDSELTALSPPEGVELLGGYERMVKGSGVLVSKRYAVSTAVPEATEHFRRQLVNRGWAPCAPKEPTLCKHPYQASIEVMGGAPSAIVVVQLYWR